MTTFLSTIAIFQFSHLQMTNFVCTNATNNFLCNIAMDEFVCNNVIDNFYMHYAINDYCVLPKQFQHYHLYTKKNIIVHIKLIRDRLTSIGTYRAAIAAIKESLVLLFENKGFFV